MTMTFLYRSLAAGTFPAWTVDLGNQSVRLGRVGFSYQAQTGATATSSITIDDPDGTVGHASDGIVGLKILEVTESDGSAGHQNLFYGYIGDRTYRRGSTDRPSLITTAAREIDATLIDINAFLSFRVFKPHTLDATASFNRPAETDLARITALLGVSFLSGVLMDRGMVASTGAVNMDACDYSGQRPFDVLNDCAQQSGRNFFAYYDEAHPDTIALFYNDLDATGYDSTLQLTNILSEADQSTTFAVEPDAYGTLDPARIAAGVYMPYANGVVYSSNSTTADTFAYRDQVASSVNVKSAAQANARSSRYLTDNSTEDNLIHCTVQLPSDKVTLLQQGHRVRAHFSHIPGVQSTLTWCRVLERTVAQDEATDKRYTVGLVITPVEVPTSYVSNVYIQSRGDINGGVTGAPASWTMYYYGNPNKNYFMRLSTSPTFTDPSLAEMPSVSGGVGATCSGDSTAGNGEFLDNYGAFDYWGPLTFPLDTPIYLDVLYQPNAGYTGGTGYTDGKTIFNFYTGVLPGGGTYSPPAGLTITSHSSTAGSVAAGGALPCGYFTLHQA